VDLEEELSEIVKSSSEINNGFLSKIGFTKVDGKWISKGGDKVGSSSGAQAEEENEVAATGDESITSMTPFERLMINRMDDFADKQKSLYELCDRRSRVWIQGFRP